MMNIKDLASYINVDIIPLEWEIYYNVALESFDKDWVLIDFNEIFDFYNLEADFRKRFLKEIEVLKNDINLNFLVYLWHYIIFYMEDQYKISRWKNKNEYFKDNGSNMMAVVSMLMGYKIHKKVMEDNNYDEEQIKSHKENICLTCISDHKRIGLDGIRFSQMVWGSRFMKGHIIEVGSLQYELKTDFYNGEDVIFVHIPRNADFSKEALDYTFKNARRNVNKYLTTNNYKFMTESWLLSPELKSVLKSDSKILYFQNYFDLIEVKENITDFLNFVFNSPMADDYNSLSSDTSLQRNLKEKLLIGEKLHIGIGILK